MLQKSTLDFLSKLAKNNHKEWFDKNRPLYEAAKKDMEQFTNALIKEVASFDSSISTLKAKDCTFRINRDVRFSKNKEPYKNNMGAYLSPGGKKSVFAGYYVHIEPSGYSFLAGGIYVPDTATLAKIRQEIDYNTDEFKKIISSKSFVKTFGEIAGEQVKTAPKGYDKEHPEINLLKYKSYTVSHKIDREIITDKNFVKYCGKVFKEMYPFNNFLNRAVSE
jgi:uncharacterized protein (TIGR02453 family)